MKGTVQFGDRVPAPGQASAASRSKTHYDTGLQPSFVYGYDSGASPQADMGGPSALFGTVFQPGLQRWKRFSYQPWRSPGLHS